MRINAENMDYRTLNQALRSAGEDCLVSGCRGQRFIGAGMSGRNIVIDGIPGNALGAYLNGACITVNGSVQDAVGDTMNDGRIVIHGSMGDTAGYAMRGGKIFVKGNAGYRAGVHMKAYEEKSPVMVIGGKAGSFLGEYQAGGTIIVLGLETGDQRLTGFFPCTGMHGGRVFLRSDCRGTDFPGQVTARPAAQRDMEEIAGDIREFCTLFGYEPEWVLDAPFTLVTPDSKNPYRQMYVAN